MNTRPLPDPPSDSMRSIFRTAPDTHGIGGCWQVTIRRGQMQYNASFSDSVFKNAQDALRAAQMFRDALLERLPKPVLMNITNARKAPSGIKGVRRITHSGQAYWQARLRTEIKEFCRYFPIRKYGEEGARQRAADMRADWVRMLGGSDIVSLPTEEDARQLANTIRAHCHKQTPRKPGTASVFNETDRYGISRRNPDAEGKRGSWKVSIGRHGVLYEKRFSDATAGGENAALAAAIRYRDRLLTSIQPITMRERYEQHRRNNTSGVPGVRLRKERGVAIAWRTSITLRKKEQAQSFSIRQYGYEQAFEMAVAARKKMLEQVLAQIKDGYFVYSPVAKEWYSSK